LRVAHIRAATAAAGDRDVELGGEHIGDLGRTSAEKRPANRQLWRCGHMDAWSRRQELLQVGVLN
jgi:hypothetical protein